MIRTTAPLTIETGRVDRAGRWSVLKLAGELDVAGLPALQARVDEVRAAGPAPRLILDLTGVTFMDSCGLSGIVRAWKQVTSAGGGFALVGVRHRVRRVLHITRMLGVFEVYDTMDDFPASA